MGVMKKELPNGKVQFATKLLPHDLEALRDLADRLGYLHRKRGGEPSVTAMLEDLARGRLTLTKG